MELLPEQQPDSTMACVCDGSSMFETHQTIIEEVMTKVEGLDSQKKKELSNLLIKYIDIFANSSDFGRTGKIRHSIDTGSSAPIHQPVRRVPPVKREVKQKLLDNILEKKVIKPSTSRWASAVVLVTKRTTQQGPVWTIANLTTSLAKMFTPFPGSMTPLIPWLDHNCLLHWI